MVEPADTSVIADLMDTPQPYDTRLTFPRSGKELWASSTALRQASPYFVDMLESGFTESEVQPVQKELSNSPSAAAALELDWLTDSEGEDDQLNPAPQHLVPPHPDQKIYSVEIVGHAPSTYKAVLVWTVTHYIRFAPLSRQALPSRTRNSRPARGARSPQRRLRTGTAFPTLLLSRASLSTVSPTFSTCQSSRSLRWTNTIPDSVQRTLDTSCTRPPAGCTTTSARRASATPPRTGTRSATLPR